MYFLDSELYVKVTAALTNTRLVKGIKKASPLDQTSWYEGFHSVLNQFAPKMTPDEMIDSHLIRNSCECDANLVVKIGNHCEFIFATIQICTTFAIIFALMRIYDKIGNTFAQRCQFEANVCII